jgi:hypothetical protein
LIFEKMLAADHGSDSSLRDLIQVNQLALFSDAAAVFLRQLRQQHVRSPRLREQVDHLESLLSRCREGGINAAFDESSSRSPFPDVPPQHLFRGAVVKNPPDTPSTDSSLPEVDLGLVGTWANSRSEGRDPVVLRTEYYKLLENGTAIRSDFMSYVGTLGGIRAGNTRIREIGRGVWSARDGVLSLSDNRGNAISCRYRIQGNRLICQFGNGAVQEWKRSY